MASLFLQLVLAALLVGDGWATPVTDAKSKYGITCSKTSSCRNYAVSGFKANALAQLNDILVNQTTNFPDVRFGSDEPIACARTLRSTRDKNSYLTACARFYDTDGTLADAAGNVTSLLKNSCNSCGTITFARSGKFSVDVSESTLDAWSLPENCIRISELSADLTTFLCPKGFTLPQYNDQSSNYTIGDKTWGKPIYHHQTSQNLTIDRISYQNTINTIISGAALRNPSEQPTTSGINATAYTVESRRKAMPVAFLFIPSQINISDADTRQALNFLGLQYNGAFDDYEGFIYLDKNRTRTTYSLILGSG